jgi:3-methyl-2-oxobutanoate hydroxymethyltransferase
MTATEARTVTIEHLRSMKARSEPIVVVTAFDHPSARVAERAGVDIVLVGDSAAMTVLGYPTTREVSLDEMLMMTRAVRRGLTTPMLIGDLPFHTYEDSDAHALETGRRFVDAGCVAVKLEGAGPMVDRVRALTHAGIPVMGHVGLTPQQVTSPAGYRARGRMAEEAISIVRDALDLERAGCFSLVVEAVAAPVADAIMAAVTVPVIGIGAGAAPDGHVLVFSDLVGLGEMHAARFVKRYANVDADMVEAVTRYASDIREHRYPGPEHGYAMPAEELARFRERLAAAQDAPSAV